MRFATYRCSAHVENLLSLLVSDICKLLISLQTEVKRTTATSSCPTYSTDRRVRPECVGLCTAQSRNARHQVCSYGLGGSRALITLHGCFVSEHLSLISVLMLLPRQCYTTVSECLPKTNPRFEPRPEIIPTHIQAKPEPHPFFSNMI